MSEYSDAAIVGALRRTMTIAAAKQVVAASNIANVNTPGYRAREVRFSDALDEHLVTLRATQVGHIAPSPSGASTDTQETLGLQERRDGNNVQMDQELLGMSRAGGEFARAQTALAAKFRLVRYAITESR